MKTVTAVPAGLPCLAPLPPGAELRVPVPVLPSPMCRTGFPGSAAPALLLPPGHRRRRVFQRRLFRRRPPSRAVRMPVAGSPETRFGPAVRQCVRNRFRKGFRLGAAGPPQCPGHRDPQFLLSAGRAPYRGISGARGRRSSRCHFGPAVPPARHPGGRPGDRSAGPLPARAARSRPRTLSWRAGAVRYRPWAGRVGRGGDRATTLERPGPSHVPGGSACPVLIRTAEHGNRQRDSPWMRVTSQR